MHKFLSLFLVILCFNGLAQNNPPRQDSLHQVWLDENLPDSVRNRAYFTFILPYLNSNPDTAYQLSKKLLENSKKTNDKNGEAAALTLAGITFSIKGNQKEALNNYRQSLAVRKEIGDKRGISNNLANIGRIYSEIGNLEEALSYSLQSLELLKETNNLGQVGQVSLNVGTFYFDLGDDTNALKYYNEALEIAKQVNDSLDVARTLGNIGILYRRQGELSEALKYMSMSLSIREDLADSRGLSNNHNNLALVYKDLKDLPKALYHGKLALEISQELGISRNIGNAAGTLSDIYEMQGKGMLALNHYKLFVKMTDSLKNEEAKKGILKMEVEHDFEKQQIIAKQEAEEQARIEAEKVSRRNSIQYSGIGLGIFVLFGLVFLFGRIQLPAWAVELSVFLPFLILFEFLLVISDPYVDAWSGGEPLIKLGINVAMAAAIFPLHSFFERFLKQRLFKA